MSSTEGGFRRFWNYLKAVMTFRLNERADPRIQLEQAISEARGSHRRLKEQAANVIANQKHAELKLDRKIDDAAKLQSNAKQALLMADEATRKGDATKAAQFERTAETIATQLIAVEQEVEDLQDLMLQAAQATDQAKAAVEQSSHLLQQKIAEKQKLVGQLDQAKMAEALNETMGQLTEEVGKDVPTFDEVRDKIEARLAKAQGHTELAGSSAEVRIAEVEAAGRNMEAHSRLSELRSQLGIATEAAPVEAPAVVTADAPLADADAAEGEAATS